MPSVVLSSVSARREGSITEPTFKWTLAGVHSFVDLEVRFVEELLTACALNTYISFKEELNTNREIRRQTTFYIIFESNEVWSVLKTNLILYLPPSL